MGLVTGRATRLYYMDETSFNAQERPLKCWQFAAQPLQFPIPIVRPHNITIFGAVGNMDPKLLFFMASSTNQHDCVRFLKLLRRRITRRAIKSNPETHIVLDNHSAHRAGFVRSYIEEDFRSTGHRFVLVFQPPYSSQFNS